MNNLIKLHALDNVKIIMEETGKPIGIGHKIAARFIAAGEKIIKYGVPIGSATKDIERGMHVHLHNMKSDYIPTYTVS